MQDRKLVILAGGISSRMKRSAATELDSRLVEDANKRTKSMIGVGREYRPFLDYVLYNANQAGYTDVTIVMGEQDESIPYYYGAGKKGNKFLDLSITYAIQTIPPGREKPLGTADALHQALRCREDWRGGKFTVCNSDNLYSVHAFSTLLLSPYPNAMCDYDRAFLEFEAQRIERFAATFKDDEGFLLDICEKPDQATLQKARDKNGVIGVSMNIFRLDYDMVMPMLERVPVNPERNEKEIPDAIRMMIAAYPKSLYAYPFAEHVPDLTLKNDIPAVREYLLRNFIH